MDDNISTEGAPVTAPDHTSTIKGAPPVMGRAVPVEQAVPIPGVEPPPAQSTSKATKNSQKAPGARGKSNAKKKSKSKSERRKSKKAVHSTMRMAAHAEKEKQQKLKVNEANALTAMFDKRGRSFASIAKRNLFACRRSTEDAINFGKLASSAKHHLKEVVNPARTKAGMSRLNWTKWLEQHGVDPKRAQRDMKLASYFSQIIVDPLPPISEAYAMCGAVIVQKSVSSDLDREEHRLDRKEEERWKEYEQIWQPLRSSRVTELEPLIADAGIEMQNAFATAESKSSTLLTKVLSNKDGCQEFTRALQKLATTLRDDMVIGAVIFQLPPTGAKAKPLTPEGGTTW